MPYRPSLLRSSTSCPGPNSDRSLSQIKAVWIWAIGRPVCRIAENSGGRWRDAVRSGWQLRLGCSGSSECHVRHGPWSPTCPGPNSDRSLSQIKAVWIWAIGRPVCRIAENSGGRWRDAVRSGWQLRLGCSGSSECHVRHGPWSPTCPGPNSDRSLSQIKAVWIWAIGRPVCRYCREFWRTMARRGAIRLGNFAWVVAVPDQILIAVFPKLRLYGFGPSEGRFAELPRILEDDGATRCDPAGNFAMGCSGSSECHVRHGPWSATSSSAASKFSSWLAGPGTG